MASKMSPEAQAGLALGGVAVLGLGLWYFLGGKKSGGGGGSGDSTTAARYGLSISPGCLDLSPIDAGKLVARHSEDISNIAKEAISNARSKGQVNISELSDELTEDFVNGLQAGCPTPPSSGHPSYTYYQAVRRAFEAWLTAYAEAAK